MRNVVDLLEMLGERKVKERAARGGELHRGAQPALHDRQVSDGEMLVEVVYVPAQLQSWVLRETRHIDARAGDGDATCLGQLSVNQRPCGECLAEQMLADLGPAHGADDKGPIRVVAKARADGGYVGIVGRVETR